MDHVEAFERYSRFGIQKLNTDVPLPGRVAEIDFELVIVHYSVISAGFYPFTEDHLRWLKTSKAHKVLFVQDELMYCRQRFWFCDEIGVDTLYTLLEPSEFERVYGSHTRVPRIRPNLPGYVSEQMVADAARLGTPDEERPIDIAYRGRPLPAYCGSGEMESTKSASVLLSSRPGRVSSSISDCRRKTASTASSGLVSSPAARVFSASNPVSPCLTRRTGWWISTSAWLSGAPR